MRIVGWYKLGLSPEEIADQFGHLSLAQVHAALAYYHANREEIEADLADERTEADKLERQHYLSQHHSLAERGIPRRYGREELEDDLTYAGGD